MTKYLLDVNVILALLHSGHSHSASANAWLGSVSDPRSLGICRFVEMGVLRLLTRRAAMGPQVMSGADAWSVVDRLLFDDRFELAAEPSMLRETWERLCRNLRTGDCAETDVYLAAFAIAEGRTLVTFDRGMIRFAGLPLELLT